MSAQVYVIGKGSQGQLGLKTNFSAEVPKLVPMPDKVSLEYDIVMEALVATCGCFVSENTGSCCFDRGHRQGQRCRDLIGEIHLLGKRQRRW